ncbi:hypothetical protein N7490_000931 [Penicillium lividum]|nr:hypothetical protein N7490_000931 [Penicillium lividum]
MSSRDSVVDLTASTDQTRQALSPSASLHFPSSRNDLPIPQSPDTTARGVKRRHTDDDSCSSTLSESSEDEQIEAIDLTDAAGSSFAKVLAKQREDAIKAQQSQNDNDEGASLIKAYKCPICMDTPENATTTACGHLFCHRCILECLNRSYEQPDNPNKFSRGTCPVCRKPITRNEAPGPRRSLIPLQLKLMTRKRGDSAVIDA